MRSLSLALLALALFAFPAFGQSAAAENYGVGTLINNSGTAGTIPMPAAGNPYTSTRVRGHYFTAPVAFAVIGLKVPDVNSLGYQTLALYRLPKAPPAYSQTMDVKPLFFKRWAKAGNFVNVLPPVVFNQGDIYAVLGGCSANNSTTLANPYGTSQPKVSVGGKTVTLYRCGMQYSIAAATGPGANGIGPLWSENSGSISRVDAKIVVYKNPFPRLDTTALPILGKQATVQLTGNIPNAPIGLVALGRGRVSLPTPFGTVLAGFPWVLTANVIKATGPVNIPIPNDPVLTGGKVTWQGFVTFLPTNFGTTNGVEWTLGN